MLKPVLLTAILGFLASSAHADSILLELQPGSNAAATGDSISLDIVVSGLGEFAPDSLGAFDITVGFDATALSLTGYSLGPYLGDPSLSEALDASSGDLGGSVNVAEVSLLSTAGLDVLQPGSFTVATLNFDVTSLVLGAVTQLSVLPGAILGDAFGAQLAVAGVGGASVANVPVPGTFILLLLPLGGLLALGRARQAHRPPRQQAGTGH
ncbi:MAG: cohesin domain-containing protein [Halioglobus sp.]|nr:cohesin domain-containing protein [Halioglobus sp.]